MIHSLLSMMSYSHYNDQSSENFLDCGGGVHEKDYNHFSNEPDLKTKSLFQTQSIKF